MSLSKCTFFLFLTFYFLTLQTFNLGAQGLTKYGESTTTSTNFVDKNGKIGSRAVLGKYGQVHAIAIGDSYQGGIVAYILQSGDPGYDVNVQHGLIAAPTDQADSFTGTGAVWGCTGTTISGADGTAIGTGNQNTIDIMAGCSTAGIAARLCGDLVLGGYSDWYLPSKDELNQLYINRVVVGVSSFNYWSSSEYNASDAWVQYFTGGSQYSYTKDYSIFVRAVRSFPFVCGGNLTINHTIGTVAPETKSVIYGTVTTSLSGASKCWITQNLGSSNQATSATDATEVSAGWYWQFNLKQGYKHDGSTLTPAWTITSINENSDWLAANDPCTIELGTGWRIPTTTEWTNADANGQTGGWDNYTETFADVLKLHAVGYLDDGVSPGSLYNRGAIGYYWSSTQGDVTNGWSLYFDSSNSYMYSRHKTYGFSLRCLRD